MVARLVGWIGFAVLIASCYVPDLVDCTVRCAADGDCADGQQCDADGYCAAPGSAGRCATASVPDASTVADATVDDSPQNPPQDTQPPTDGPTSPPVMTCGEGGCIIDCTATGSCMGDVSCPAGQPCRVVCGDDACDRVHCELASSCLIECSGKNSCAGAVICGLGRCEVGCLGRNSCRKGVDCRAACACDVSCSGPMSCKEDATCPSDDCEQDEGCSSHDHGFECNRCP